ncbi:MAG: pilus assembly protein TadG-related protein [Acidimicrobiales bacterium]
MFDRVLRRCRSPRGERGATAVVIALLTVPLFGVGALVVDVGALYQEKRELQNGADAAALAVARDCGNGACGALTGTADSFSDANANDGASNIDSVCGFGPGLFGCTPAPVLPTGSLGYVKVTNSTHDISSGINQITYGLAKVLTNETGKTVRASAVAAWGAPGDGRLAPPLIASVCEVDDAVDSDGDGVRVFQSGPPYLGSPTTLIFHGSNPGPLTCQPTPSGGDLPGGFGWLASTNCSAFLTAGDWVATDTGNNGLPSGCSPSAWQNKTILLPIYDLLTGTGSNGRYHVAGFAAFYVVGYKIGNQTWGTGVPCAGQNGNSGRCLVGHFTTYVTSTDSFNGDDFGVVGVKITG